MDMFDRRRRGFYDPPRGIQISMWELYPKEVMNVERTCKDRSEDDKKPDALQTDRQDYKKDK